MYRKIVRGTIWWEVLDEDPKGRRALIRPIACPHVMTALAGRDLRTGRPFFIPLPPYIRNVNEAMDWIFRLPPGTWAAAEKWEA